MDAAESQDSTIDRRAARRQSSCGDAGLGLTRESVEDHMHLALRRYANLNLSVPSFSIVLAISSPGFNHTCLSLG